MGLYIQSVPLVGRRMRSCEEEEEKEEEEKEEVEEENNKDEEKENVNENKEKEDKDEETRIPVMTTIIRSKSGNEGDMNEKQEENE